MKRVYIVFIGIFYSFSSALLTYFSNVQLLVLNINMNNGFLPYYIDPDIFSITMVMAWIVMIPYVLFIISTIYIFYFNLNRAIFFGLIGCFFHLAIYLIMLSFGVLSFLFERRAFYIIIYTFFLCFMFAITIVLFLLKYLETMVNQSLIKRTILELGTQFTQVEIREIHEECKINISSIIEVVKEMIEKKEIYGEYFSSSKSISFDQQANISEIDNLMKKYIEWENVQFQKK